MTKYLIGWQVNIFLCSYLTFFYKSRLSIIILKSYNRSELWEKFHENAFLRNCYPRYVHHMPMLILSYIIVLYSQHMIYVASNNSEYFEGEFSISIVSMLGLGLAGI